MDYPNVGHDAWEARWSPYDEPTYQQVLDFITPDDIVLEIGAGDLRLARRIAEICKRVYAVENQYHVLKTGKDSSNNPFKGNLFVVCADARQFPFPVDITTGVLLIRHCNYFGLYAEKLQKSGAKRIITNARWGFGVEVVHLHQPRKKYSQVSIGEYACICGATGFVPGPAEEFTCKMMNQVQEVGSCPQCEKLIKTNH